MSVCLVGTRWGQVMGAELRAIYKGPLFVCGRDPERTRGAAKRLGAQEPLIGWEAAVCRPDIHSLILAIPAHLHRDVACAALRAGKHVLVEKPLATNLAECDSMIEAAQEAGAVLAAGENVPFRPAVQQARRIIGLIGEPRLFFGCALHSPNRQNDLQTGILLDFSVHYIRAVRELYGEPERIYASCAPGLGGNGFARDNVTLLLSSAAGWQATLVFSWQASAGRCPEFIATGSEGALKIWPDNAGVELYPIEPGFLTRAVAAIRPHWLQRKLQTGELQRRRFRVSRQDRMGYRAELRHFLDLAELGRPDVHSATEARRDLEIVMAAQRSLATGAPVECRAAAKLQLA